MSEVDEDVELLRRSGAYESEAAVIEDAFRTLLRTKPALRTELAVEKYRTGRVSINRAAELAGCSAIEFRELLADRGVARDAGYLSDDDREKYLDDL